MDNVLGNKKYIQKELVLAQLLEFRLAQLLDILLEFQEYLGYILACKKATKETWLSYHYLSRHSRQTKGIILLIHLSRLS